MNYDIQRCPCSGNVSGDCPSCDSDLPKFHQRRGMGAEDYCTCDGPWPCPNASA